ncbi:phage tail terminator family protein [Enterococcus gilvus]|uniref:phage tail terminator family protein n=1 Tax=Enterococcus gilvus TaxID=160453 RepID=UPI003ED97F47
MKDRIIAAIGKKLKQIYSDGTIYLDSVMQSEKDFYFVLSVMESGTDNVGIDVQNIAFLIDIALVDNKKDDELINQLVSRCGAFFNVLEIEGNAIFPEDYLPDKVDGVQHIRFTVAFPQYIEWSEE